MKTQSNHLPKALTFLMQTQQNINSWVAKQIGPTVFCYGTKKESWNLKTEELLRFPEGSIGKEMGKFLNNHHIEPLAKAEYHDVQHVLFDFSISFVDEVALQFFLRGNGIKTIASVTTTIGAWAILPFHWNYLRCSYNKGKMYHNVSILNNKTILYENMNEIKKSLLK